MFSTTKRNSTPSLDSVELNPGGSVEISAVVFHGRGGVGRDWYQRNPQRTIAAEKANPAPKKKLIRATCFHVRLRLDDVSTICMMLLTDDFVVTKSCSVFETAHDPTEDRDKTLNDEG